MLPLRFWATNLQLILERGGLGDVVAAARGGLAPITEGTAEERLRAAVADLGCEVHDFRGWDRSIMYPREYGYFRDKGDFDHDGNTKEYGRFPPLRGKASGVLPIERLSTMVLHTTDSIMSWRRFLGTPCTIGISDDPAIVLCHPVLARLAHAHSANAFSNGMEISGKKGDATELQLKLAWLAMVYWHEVVSELREQAIADGKRLVASRLCVAPHRLYHDTRRNDPDPDEPPATGRIWYHIGERAKCELNMGEAPCPTRHPKRMIPRHWRFGPNGVPWACS